MPHELLGIGKRITALPIIHGSGDFAIEVRRFLLENAFDCLAVPLPPSFQEDVETAIELLPAPTVVIQGATRQMFKTSWSPDDDRDEDDDPDDAPRALDYVPIDPCQGVIAGVRVALGEHKRRAFIDMETELFEPISLPLPDPYALKQARLERFVAALAPSIGRLPDGQPTSRVRHMARRLRELEAENEHVVLLCSVLEWPWIREAYCELADDPEIGNDGQGVDWDDVISHRELETQTFQVNEDSLLFVLGELPFISGLYEQARAQLDDDENLSVDGVKELLLTARGTYVEELGGRARRITPQLLAHCLKYVRNLSLVERRLTPDLYSIVIAAKQVAGDQFAMHVAETARAYPFSGGAGLAEIKMGVEQSRLPGGEIVGMVSRLPGPPVTWRSCELKRRPDRREKERWRTRWNPFSQCSYPPEDELIENFRSHVVERAKQIMGADLVRTEKFSTSIKDGIDIRETLRHWYEREIYVKEIPPSRGTVEVVVLIFDMNADF
ncbi:MAG: hypothetical protein QF805_12075, partial [Pirellulaceae bacterium]|nr:hypothetical protein [Pirellulaceae bacterium]